MIKGRTSESSVSGSVRVEVPRFVRVKRQAKVAGTVSDSGKGSGSDKVGDKKVTAVFVRKSAATPLKEEGSKRSKETSITISPKGDVYKSPGGKRRLSAAHHGEGGVSEGSRAKRTKVETEVLARKSKRKKKKHGQKVVVTPAKKDHLEDALSYVKAWHNQRETWSFKKKMQLCLLEHMYDSSKVRKSSFAILLKYLAGLEGRSRGVEVQKAKQIVEDYDCQHLDGVEEEEEPGEVDNRNGTAYTRRQYKRAVEVLRVLA